MNRRAFLKSMLTMLSVPFIPKGFTAMLPTSTNRYGDLLKDALEAIRNNTVNDFQISELQRTFNEFSDRENIYKSWMDRSIIKADVIQPPMQLLYTHVLEKDEASVVVNVTTGRNNLPIHTLLITMSGRITAATGGQTFMQINGDTGSNYDYTSVYGNGSSANSFAATGFTQMLVGYLSNTNDAANSASNFVTYIIHSNSNWHKATLSQAYQHDNASHLMLGIGGRWRSTSPITSIEIYATDNTSVKGTANIAKDSLISVYGMM